VPKNDRDFRRAKKGGSAMSKGRTAYNALFFIVALLCLPWAGGCGGDVATEPVTPPPPPTPKAVITLNTTGNLNGGTAIGGLGVTINLPDSVSVKTTGGNVDGAVVKTSGVATGQATLLVLYSGATTTAPAKLHIVLASSTDGLQVGEFATVTCDIVTGSGPVESDFSLSDFAPVDIDGAAIQTLTASLHTTVH
jgi:hypothetical protein